jgi:hypothetical protein
MVKRMKNVMGKIVLDHQTSFVPGQNINENITKLLEAKNCTCIIFKSLHFLFFNFGKKIDFICKNILQNSLKKLNLDPILFLNFSHFTTNQLQSQL